MKKIYIAPEMEILDAELEGFLASSVFEDPGTPESPGVRQYGGGGFEDFDDFEEDEF